MSGRRYAAHLIDSVIFWLLALVPLIAAAVISSAASALTLLFLLLPGPVVYYVLTQRRSGQSPGERAVGIEVVTASGDVPSRTDELGTCGSGSATAGRGPTSSMPRRQAKADRGRRPRSVRSECPAEHFRSVPRNASPPSAGRQAASRFRGTSSHRGRTSRDFSEPSPRCHAGATAVRRQVRRHLPQPCDARYAQPSFMTATGRARRLR